MEVQVHNSTTILCHANLNSSELPLTIFDLLAPNVHVAVLFAFAPPTPSNSQLIHGLSETLLHFPALTARLGYDRHRRPCLLAGGRHGGGALVVEASVSSNLSDHMPLEPSRDLLALQPSTAEPDHLLQIQLNRFACGGLAIAVTSHHKAADGQAMGNFCVAWGQAVRGAPIDPLPFHDQSWLDPRREFRGWDLDFVPSSPDEAGFAAAHQNDANELFKVADELSNVANVLLHYSREFIAAKLKPEVKGKYTTLETLSAHVWRKMTVARGLEGEQQTMVRISVNGRRRLNPPVPDEFFGNLVLNGCAKSNVKRLLEGGLEEAAKTIHDAIARTDEHYFKSIMEIESVNNEEEEKEVMAAERNGLRFSRVVELDSWLRLGFKEVEFGGGAKLCAFLPVWLPVEGMVVLLPALGEDGGVDVVVTLIEEHATRLRQISLSLD